MNVIECSTLAKMRRVRHGFYGRRGGVSQGLFASLNCGYGSGDEVERVRENRTRAARRLGVAHDRLLTVYQIHSPDAVVVDTCWAREAQPKADAMATSAPNIALGILAADCAPVLLADERAGVIGAAHAGWKGALGGVVESAVAAMETLGAKRRDIAATIGPCIGQPSYEVGAEFRAQFLAAAETNAAYFTQGKRADHYQFDLPAYVRGRLETMGLAAVNAIGRCTYADDADYFSFRRTTHRSETDYGRNLSAIMLAP
jgi:YfiH family protein